MPFDAMTVGKLKEFLKDLPDDMEVMVSDSEWGSDIIGIYDIKIDTLPANDYMKEERKFLVIG